MNGVVQEAIQRISYAALFVVRQTLDGVENALKLGCHIALLR